MLMVFFRKKDSPSTSANNKPRYPSGFKSSAMSSKPSDNRRHKISKPLNPRDANGDLILCSSCGSFRHLLDKCPDSYENLSRPSAHNVLISHVGALAYEASNKAVIDSACTSSVAGEEWMDTMMDSLNDEERISVIKTPSLKHFKFGGGEVLQSLYSVDFPCVIGSKEVRLQADVVKSDIPLLLSSKTLEKANCLWDLGHGRIKLFGEWIECDKTSSGLFVISLGKTESPLPIENVCAALEMDDIGTSRKYLLKLHRQFGHTSKGRFCDLLKDAGKWKESYQSIIDTIYESCKTCILHSKVTPRPVCELPVASEFAEVLTMDLKECNAGVVKGHKYILHMIDGFTRYSVSVFISRKLP